MADSIPPGVQAENCCASNRLVCGEDWDNYTYTCPEHQETLDHTSTRAVHYAIYLPGLKSRLQGDYAKKAYSWSQLREKRLKERSMLVTGHRERRDDLEKDPLSGKQLQHLQQGDERDLCSLQRAVPENWDEEKRRGDLEVGKTFVDSVQVFTCCSSSNYSVHLDADYDVIVLPNTKYSH